MMEDLAFFSICAKNYLPYAKTLFDSLRRQYGKASLYLILADRIDGYFNADDFDFEIIEAESIPIDDFAGLTFRYDITEFSTAIKPSCFQYLFDHGNHRSLVYLDPDIYVTNRMTKLEQLLTDGAEAVLTPHICAPIEDKKKPDDRAILEAGTYNLGFVAMRDTRGTRAFLDWWGRHLQYECCMDLRSGLHVDQKWVDLLPAFVEETEILRHPGYNAAYWNLMHRKVRRTPDGWRVNDLPLVFFHFSGVESSDPRVLSKHQTRFHSRNIGDVKQLLDLYRRAVDINDRPGFSSQPYAYGSNGHGHEIHPLVRRIYREVIEDRKTSVADPFAAAVAYCNSEAPDVVQDRWLLITRLMYRLWSDRSDLQSSFDLTKQKGRRGFVEWYLHASIHEVGLDDIFVAVVLSRYRLEFSAPDESGERSEGSEPPSTLQSRVAGSLLATVPRFKPLYIYLPVKVRHEIKVALLRRAYPPVQGNARGQSADRSRANSKVTDASKLRPGALLVGYPRAELGMGEHIRLSAQALATTPVRFGIYSFEHNVAARQQDKRFVNHVTYNASYKANVFHINADQMLLARDTLGQQFFAGRYNIGYWAWELSEFPDNWLPALDLMQEIWAPSRFIENAIAEKARCPVRWMPLAVHVTAPPQFDRKFFGLAEDAFIFLFYFDFASYSTRKNPYAVVDAFRRAFDGRSEKVALVVKATGLDSHREELVRMREALEGDPRITLIDKVISHDEIAGLVNCCDSFVSLHRSEGFGRGLAEAMFLGKPVIATNYSGNTDFTRKDTACLVNYSLVPVEPGAYPESRGQVWADPDIDHAAWHMRRLAERSADAQRLAAAGKKYIHENHSLARVGARYKERLERLGLWSGDAPRRRSRKKIVVRS